MPVIAPPHRKSAEVERATAENITALDTPNIQLYMTYSGKAEESSVSPECLAWLDARAAETGLSVLDILIGCAEMCADLE